MPGRPSPSTDQSKSVVRLRLDVQSHIWLSVRTRTPESVISLAAPSASHMQQYVSAIRNPEGGKKCIILPTASVTCHMCQCLGGNASNIMQNIHKYKLAKWVAYLHMFACMSCYFANLAKGVGMLTCSARNCQYRLSSLTNCLHFSRCFCAKWLIVLEL